VSSPVNIHENRHREERSDEAIQGRARALDRFAALAMTELA